MNKSVSVEQDENMLSAMLYGSSKAFDVLFKKYYKPLCAYAFRFVELADAEEIVQDILLWLWESRENLNIQSSLSSYLFTAVHRRCLTCIAQKSVKQRSETHYWEMHSEKIPLGIEVFQADELISCIQKAIERLPSTYREAFVLHRFKDCSYKEIASQLNVSPKTVDYRIQQALKLLRADLKNYFPLFLLFLVQ
jgi:RNA polymerase sigma-70 factor (ECF subfamily)